MAADLLNLEVLADVAAEAEASGDIGLAMQLVDALVAEVQVLRGPPPPPRTELAGQLRLV